MEKDRDKGVGVAKEPQEEKKVIDYLIELREEEASSMSVSAIFGCRVAMAPHSIGNDSVRSIPRNDGVLVIECSSRPKKKSTAHHMKTRPRKTQPWDIKRKPTVYPPLPPLPPDYSVVISSDHSSVPSPPDAADATLAA